MTSPAVALVARDIPRSARATCGHPGRPSGVRLTRRGRLVVAFLAILAMSAALLIGTLRTAEASGPPSGWINTQVLPGDTLWSIARDLDPGADPRPLIAHLRVVNGLSDAQLVPGQSLWVPPNAP